MSAIRKFFHILYFTAGCFLLMHNLIPHIHHGQMSEFVHIKEHEAATNLIDQLKLIFHTDLGANHLEWVSQISYAEDGYTLDDKVPNIATLIAEKVFFDVFPVAKNLVQRVGKFIALDPFLLHFSLRAPPIIA